MRPSELPPASPLDLPPPAAQEDLLAWFKQIAKETDHVDWRQGIHREYRSFMQQSSLRLPLALLRAVVRAPTQLGQAIREEMISSPTQPVTAGEGRQRDLLPLPWCTTAAEAAIPPTPACRAEPYVTHRRAFLLLMTLVLNYQYLRGPDGRCQQRLLPMGPPTPAQALAAGLLGQAADVFIERNSRTLGLVDWTEELRNRRACDYGGQEASGPEPLSLARMLPALPPPGIAASFWAEDFATGTVLEVLKDPSLIVTNKMGKAPCRTKLHCEEGEEDLIAEHLVKIGILEEAEDEDGPLFGPAGEDIEAGGFGVIKAKAKKVFVSGKGWLTVLRLVWNLRPVNDFLLDFDADVDGLATPAQYSNLVLLPREWLLLSAADRAVFFYIFRFNKLWKRLQRSVLRHPRSGRRLSLVTIGMGLKPAVTITLHLHRNVVLSQEASGLRSLPLRTEGGQPSEERVSMADAGPGLPPQAEVRRDRATPFGPNARDAWLTFIDDLRISKIIDDHEADWLIQSSNQLFQAAKGRYALVAWPGEDLGESQLELTSLGERIHGGYGRRDLPDQYLLQVVDLGFYVAALPAPKFEIKAILQGREVRGALLERSLFSLFEATWQWTATRTRQPMPASVLAEMLAFFALLPLAHHSFRHPVDDLVLATDASMSGGAVSATAGLTALGLKVAQTWTMPSWLPSSEEILLVTFGDHLGAARRALELGGAAPAAYLALVDSSAAARILRRTYPEARILNSQPGPEHYRLHSETLVNWLEKTRRSLPRAKHLLVFMEQDEAVHDTLQWISATMAEADWDLVLHVAVHSWRVPDGRKDQQLPWASWDAEKVSLVRRTRLVAVTEPILRPWSGNWIWRDTHQILDGAAAEDGWFAPFWLDSAEDWEHQPEARYGPLAPCRRIAATGEELWDMAGQGIKWESEDQMFRWIADSGAHAPATYRDGSTLSRKGLLDFDSGELPFQRRRGLKLSEWEVAMGYPLGLTALAVPSSQLKGAAVDLLRHNLLAKASMVRLVFLSLRPILQDMGYLPHQRPANAFIAAESDHAQLERALLLDPRPPDGSPRKFGPGQALVVMALNSTGRRGFDVQALGTPGVSSRQALRSSIPTHLWSWKSAFTWKWQEEQHINVLELRALMAGVKWRARSSRAVGTLALQLTDNAASAGTMARGRSGAKQIQAVARKIGALQLAGRMRTATGFCRSDWNPADRGSRLSKL